MLLIVCYLSFYCIVAVAKGSVIYVEPTNNGSCNESIFDNSAIVSNQSLQSLLANVTSNSVLKLLPGCHHLDRYVPILDKTNVTIEGVGESPDNVTINCDRNPVGMTFVNTSQLNVRMLTLQDCGLSGVNLNDTINHIKDNYLNSFESIFKLSLNNEIGLFIVVSSDVTLDTIVVKGVHGFGLLAVNVINSFQIESSLFAYNYNETCFSSSEYGLSGGASIIFQDNDMNNEKLDINYILNIENTKFLHNSNCAIVSQSETYSSRIDLALNTNDSYSYGGGGGLTVYLANHNYSVSVNVTGCLFKNNTATNGGGMFLGTFVGTDENTVTIKGSMFFRNGFQFGALRDLFTVTTGQGLYILKDIHFPNNPVSLPVGINQFMIVNCTFKENVATTTGGVALFSRYQTLGNFFASDSFTFKNCSFVLNKAIATSALFIFEAKQIGYQPGINVTIADTKFTNNSLIFNQFVQSSPSVIRLNTVQSTAVTITLVGKNEFANNTGTPFSLKFSILEVSGELRFCNNLGNIGGGLVLSSSFLVLRPNSNVLFENNQAYLKAGAMLFNTIEPISDYDCFLFFGSVSKVCNNFSADCLNPCKGEANITMNFTNNIAAISNVAYGSTLSSCPWVQLINSTLTINATDPFRMLEEIGVFHFNPHLTEDSLSTDAASLTAEINSSRVIMPGENTPVMVRVYDGFNQPIPNFISSVIINGSVEIAGQRQSKLGNSSYWFVGKDRFLEVPLTVFSRGFKENETQENINVTIGIYSTTSTVGQIVNVTVRNCYEGFEFLTDSDELYQPCKCSKSITSLSDPSVSCFEGNATIIVPNGYWLGNITEMKGWTLEKCVFDYCDSGDDYVIQYGQFDVQCRKEYNRKGILCGECQEGYSIQLGTNKCAKCNNLGILWFVAFFLIGMGIISLIGRLGLSVSYGYINSLMFFANVIGPFRTTLSTNIVFDYLFFPINILNGEFIATQSCIFNGMTSLDLMFINFLFPVYLYLLLLFYTALGRCCNRIFSRWAGNAPQVFATIILFTYTSFLQFCISGLSFLEIQGSIRWSIDPNVEYSHPAHIVMILLCIAVLIIVLIPAAITLTFPSITFRTFVGKKFVPIYDAVWAPFKERRHFWVGFRLLLRVIPLILAGYVPQPLNVLLLGVFICIYIFIHYVFKPFKREIQNNLEIYLNSCALLLVLGSLHDNMDPVFEGVYFGVVISLAYIAFALVIWHHLYMRSSFLQRTVAYVKLTYRNRLEGMRNTKLINGKDTTVVNDFEETDNLSFSGQFSIQNKKYSVHTSVYNSNDLRESLLDDPYL